MTILPLLMVASVFAVDFQLPPETKQLTRAAQGLGARSREQLLPRPEHDPGIIEFSFGRSLQSNGVWGNGKAEPLTAPPRLRALIPLNTGFQALGPTGAAGAVDGPGRQGNGRYRVIENSPFQVVLEMRTGYIDGRFTLKRDQATGKDSLGFSGRLWDNDAGQWGPAKNSVDDGVISYDAAADSGRIRWKEDGAWKDEGYWNGRAGRTSMTIEFGGGWDHDFSRD